MKKSIAVVIVLLMFWTACSRPDVVNPEKSGNGVKIGVFLSLTGASAGFGNSALNFFILATDEANNSGSISGRHSIRNMKTGTKGGKFSLQNKER